MVSAPPTIFLSSALLLPSPSSSPVSVLDRLRFLGAIAYRVPRPNRAFRSPIRKRLRGGLVPGPVNLDPARIEVAFDFRLQNPTLIPDLRDEAEPLRDHYYRTLDGHVVRGRSHAVPATAPDESHRFVAISSPEQITPSGVYPLPALFVNRRYLAVRALARTRDETLAVMKWVPFLPASAAHESILPLPAPGAPELATASRG